MYKDGPQSIYESLMGISDQQENKPDSTQVDRPDSSQLLKSLFTNNFGLLTENAYRILGLTANSSRREILKRFERLKSLISIGHETHFSTDFDFLGKIVRDDNKINDAIKILDSEKTRLFHVLSWFWEIDDIDKKSLEYLASNSFGAATDNWSNSSKSHHNKNLATLAYINAFLNIDLDKKYLIEYLKLWRNLNNNGTISELLHNLSEAEKLRNILSDSFGEYLNQQLIPFYDRWINEGKKEKILEIFNVIDSFPKPISDNIKSSYLNPILSKCDQIIECITELKVNSNHELFHSLMMRFSVEIVPFYELIKLAQDRFSTETYGDKIAKLIIDKSIEYGNITNQWEKTKNIFLTAERFISSPILKDRYETNLQIINANIDGAKIWGNLKKIDKAPGLSTINGIGTMLYGSTNYDVDSKSYEATRYFTFFFIPIFPIDRYRVINEGNNYYRFLGKVDLRNFDKIHIGIAIFLLLIFVINGLSQENKSRYSSSQYSQPNYQAQSVSPSQSPSTRSERETIRKKIENAQEKLRSMESELNTMVSRIESMDQELTFSRTDLSLRDPSDFEINDFNSRVSKRNSLARKYKKRIEEYNALLDKTNRNISEFNKR